MPDPFSLEGESHRLRPLITSSRRESNYLKKGLWDNVTIVDRLRRHAAEIPEATAVIDREGGWRVTFRELDRDSARVAMFLKNAGVVPGDVVAVQLPNWYAAIAITIGVLRAGAVLNPLLPAYRAKELRHMLGVCGTKVIFTPKTYRDFDFTELVASIRMHIPRLTHHVVVEPSHEAFDQLFGGMNLAPYAKVDAGQVCELIFTSGTEAAPKAIMHTERTLNFSSRTTWESLGMDRDDSVWMPAPIGHSTGLNHGARLAIYFGLKLVIQDRWDAGNGAQLIESEQCTHTLVSSTFLRDLVRACESGQHDVSSMRLFGCGGAPILPEDVIAADAIGIQCLRLYGATESLLVTWNRPTSPAEKKYLTDGCPLNDVEVEVRDDQGQPTVGSVGELFVRSPSTCVGFFNDPESTAASFSQDGWVRSGDLAILDHDGYVAIAGRKKEIIIRGGMNISPREIEDLLVQLKGVRSAAVVGLKHERLGEITCACVVLDPEAKLTLEAAVDWLRAAGLAVYKLPQRLELFDEFPLTATGKIRKHELADLVVRRG